MSELRRPCLGCGRLVRGSSRCPACATATAARRPTKPTRAGYTWPEQQRRRSVVAAWRAEHGEVCPGWCRPEHPVVPPNRLTADHIVAVGSGGSQAGELQVLCRSCNSAKGARS